MRPPTVVVTGGCGFIGSNLVHYLHREHPDWTIVNIDRLSYAADPDRVADLETSDRYRFIRLDLVDRHDVHSVLEEIAPDAVFHLAAETHVDNSIRESDPFIRSNVIGTYNLLEALRMLWCSGEAKGRLLHVSTDEVFGETAEGFFTERSPYRPSNPYAASKASSDHLVAAWHRTYGLDAVTVNCSNNYGPRQHREKLIPTVIRAALEGRPIPVYGHGENVRDWLNVEDHCRALDMIFERAPSGERYVVGARNEWRNIDLVRLICELLDEEVDTPPAGGHASLIGFVDDRPGHDLRYAVDPAKLERELGWSPRVPIQDGMRTTVRWYLNQWLTTRQDIS